MWTSWLLLLVTTYVDTSFEFYLPLEACDNLKFKFKSFWKFEIHLGKHTVFLSCATKAKVC